MLVALLVGILLGMPTWVFAFQDNTLSKLKREISRSGYDLKVEEVSRSRRETQKGLEERLRGIGFNSKIWAQGFSELRSNATKSFIVTDQKTKEEAFIIQRLYGNQRGEQVFAQFIYLPKSDFLVRVQADKILNNGTDLESFFEGSDLDNLSKISNEHVERGIPLPSFPSWLCYLGGALGCTVYCGGIGLIAMPAGVVCSLACGGMFHLACAGF